MAIEVFQCPQCGGNLEDVSRTGFYICPYCKSRMSIHITEPDPDTRPDGRRTIFDRDSGEELCYVKLPRGFCAEGFIENRLQSANWPFCMHVRAQSRESGNPEDQVTTIAYQSGVSFKEVVSGTVQRHNEGAFDQADMMPMLRLRSAEEYADAFMATSVGPEVSYQLEETFPLPKLPPEDEAAKRQAIFSETLAVLQAKTPPGMHSGVEQAFYSSTTRIYSYLQNGVAMRQAVATIISGVRIFFGAPMILFGGMNKSVFWDVPYVLTLRCRADVFEEQFENLVMFCSSMQASPAVARRIIDERNRILGYLEERQQTEFETHQRRMQEQQASFDAYNQAWHQRSESAHRAGRAAYATQMASEDRMSDMRSEATRGVNTYIRPDGTEVEYSVIYESAFANTNDGSDTFATTSKAFESADWVEMKKKY